MMNLRRTAGTATSGPCVSAAPGALILGGAHGSLAIARSLGRHGISIFFLTHDHPIAKFSRYTGRHGSWRAGATITRHATFNALESEDIAGRIDDSRV